MKLKTKIVKVLEPVQADILFETLYHGIEWEEGIRSKKGFTRLAKSIDYTMYPDLRIIIDNAIFLLRPNEVSSYAILGTYLNLYEDGNMWTPNHSHPKQHQVVLSLGAERKLVIGKKEYVLKSGEAIIFGSSIHGVPKDTSIKKPRISVATFMLPL